jgi:putative sterol carrier protein
MSENTTNGAADLAEIGTADASQLAAMVGQISDEQLAEALSDHGNRERVLDEIFNRMAEHVEPDRIKDLDAVIHFRITGAPDDGDDLYEAVFADGGCTVNHQPTTDEPRVEIAAAPVPFIKLVTGQENGPALFMSGKLKIKGDLMLASQMTGFFRIPTAKEA